MNRMIFVTMSTYRGVYNSNSIFLTSDGDGVGSSKSEMFHFFQMSSSVKFMFTLNWRELFREDGRSSSSW